ncbi:MAG TPA: hypothetical protein VJ550_03180 [Geomonas sp.]|nr:hypothetical protein [Geomonas sp.]
MERVAKFLMTMLVVTVITACAGPPKAYQIGDTSKDLGTSGIAFFRVTGQRFFGLFQYNRDTGGRGVGIRNKATGEGFNCVSRPYCEMKLPPGDYEISGLGSPAGGLLPKERPFTFTVEAGVIKYLGFIVGDYDLSKHLETRKIPAEQAYKVIISANEYGLSRPKSFFNPTSIPGEPFIQFFIIDNGEADTDHFRAAYKQLAAEKIIFDPLR